MSTRLQIGQAVRVRALQRHGHHRTPTYICGKRGVICEYLGEFCDPETLAYGGDGLPKRSLYRVHFEQTEVWADYPGLNDDSLEIEIYEHWLEPALERL